MGVSDGSVRASNGPAGRAAMLPARERKVMRVNFIVMVVFVGIDELIF